MWLPSCCLFQITSLEEARCHILRTLKQSYGDTAWWEMEFLAISHRSESSWKHAPHQSSSLQMTATAKLQTACRGTQGNCLHFPITSLAREMVRSQPTCSACLFRYPGRPADILRNTRVGSRRSDSSKGWAFPRTFYCSDRLLTALSCWDPNSCLDQGGNEILRSLSDLGNLLPVCRSCCFPDPSTLPLEKELWLD